MTCRAVAVMCPLGRRRARAKQGGVHFRSLCFQTGSQKRLFWDGQEGIPRYKIGGGASARSGTEWEKNLRGKWFRNKYGRH